MMTWGPCQDVSRSVEDRRFTMILEWRSGQQRLIGTLKLLLDTRSLGNEVSLDDIRLQREAEGVQGYWKEQSTDVRS